MVSHPELIVYARRVLLDEGPVVGGDVAMVRVLLQHVDFLFDLLLLILCDQAGWAEVKGALNDVCMCAFVIGDGLTPVTSMTLIAASWPVLT